DEHMVVTALLTCNIVPPNCTAAAFSVDDTDILLNDAFFVKHLSSHSCCSIPATTGTGRGYTFNVLIRFPVRFCCFSIFTATIFASCFSIFFFCCCLSIFFLTGSVSAIIPTCCQYKH